MAKVAEHVCDSNADAYIEVEGAGHTMKVWQRVSAIKLDRANTPQIQIQALTFFILFAVFSFAFDGFGKSYLQSYQTLPLYIFYGVLLITVNLVSLKDKTIATKAFAIVTSLIALFLAWDAHLNPNQRTVFTQDAFTYYRIHIIAILLYIFAIFQKYISFDWLPLRIKTIFGIQAHDKDGLTLLSFVSIFAGATILFALFAGLLYFLYGYGFSSDGIFESSPPASRYVVVPFLNGTLQDYDILCAIICLILTGILWMINSAFQAREHNSLERKGLNFVIQDSAKAFWRGILQVVDSLRLVLAPFIWFIAAFTIAYAVELWTRGFEFSTRFSSIFDELHIFDPFYALTIDTGRTHENVIVLPLIVLAIFAVILAAAVQGYDRSTLSRMILLMLSLVRTFILIFFAFALVMEGINFVADFGKYNQVVPIPFQADLAQIFALILLIGITVVESANYRRRMKERSSSLSKEFE